MLKEVVEVFAHGSTYHHEQLDKGFFCPECFSEKLFLGETSKVFTCKVCKCVFSAREVEKQNATGEYDISDYQNILPIIKKKDIKSWMT